jgi:hypothetical protein
VVNEGVVSTRLELKGIANLAEELQITTYLLEYTGGKMHIPTISYREIWWRTGKRKLNRRLGGKLQCGDPQFSADR